MATSLDDVLAPDAPPEEAPPAAEPPAGESGQADEPKVERVSSRRAAHRAKEMEAQGRGPDGKFLPKEAPAAEPAEKQPEAAAPKAPPAQEMTEKEKAAFAKAADETRKRQALEAELARLRGQQPAATGAQPAATQPAEKKFWDDPEGTLQTWNNKTLTEAQQIVLRGRLDTSEMLARHRYAQAGDFDANVAEFAELMKATPGLAQQWLASGDPAEFAYRTGKNHRTIKEAGNLDAVRAQIEKELRVKIEAEMKDKIEAERKERAAIPPSLSDVRGASQQHKPVFSGPTPLADILKS